MKDESARRAVRDSAELTRELMASPDLVDALVSVVRGIPGEASAVAASVTLQDATSTHTVASTDKDALVADDLQYELGEGPSLDVARQEDHVAVDDLSVAGRWPRWGPAAAELGINSLISIRLFTLNEVFGTLNIYSAKPRDFEEHDLVIAYAIAARISKILTTITRDSHLHEAIEARSIVVQAQTRLMQRYRLESDEAFELLNQLSQDNDLSLREMSEKLAGTGPEADGTNG